MPEFSSHSSLYVTLYYLQYRTVNIDTVDIQHIPEKEISNVCLSKALHYLINREYKMKKINSEFISWIYVRLNLSLLNLRCSLANYRIRDNLAFRSLPSFDHKH